MDASVITLARLLELEVPRSWQEAVAVTIEAGEAAMRGGSTVSAEGCLISTLGTVQLERVPGARLLAPDVALSSLLAELLEGQTAPPELKTLAASSQDNPVGIEALLKSLAYFERPQRQADVAALATRALALEADARADSELNRLRRTAPRGATTAKTEAPARSKPNAKRALGTLVAAVAWFLVGVVVTGWYLNRTPAAPPPSADVAPATATPAEGTAEPAAPPPSDAGGLVAAASNAINAAATAGLRAIGLAAADDSAKPPTPPPAARPAPPRKREPAATMPAPGPVAPPAVAPAPMAPTPVDLVPVAAEPEDAIAPPSPKPVFFSDGDSEVEPPVLVYPQLPKPPNSSVGAGESHFEILVNELGTVERVRLMARQARFQDRMMVSAAKAWRFKPATRDGQSVRYLLRIPTTQSPQAR